MENKLNIRASGFHEGRKSISSPRMNENLVGFLGFCNISILVSMVPLSYFHIMISNNNENVSLRDSQVGLENKSQETESMVTTPKSPGPMG